VILGVQMYTIIGFCQNRFDSFYFSPSEGEFGF